MTLHLENLCCVYLRIILIPQVISLFTSIVSIFFLEKKNQWSYFVDVRLLALSSISFHSTDLVIIRTRMIKMEKYHKNNMEGPKMAHLKVLGHFSTPHTAKKKCIVFLV